MWFQYFGGLIKTGGIMLLYKKITRIKYSSLIENSAGKLINLAAKDLEAFNYILSSVFIMSTIIFIPLCVVILWFYFGYAGLTGILTSVIVFGL